MDLIEAVILLFVGIIGSGSIAGIIIQHKYEKLRVIEEKLREERRKVYFDLIKPYVFFFSKRAEEGLKIVKSSEYRKTVFELNLLGSDEVVKKFGELMQFTYQGRSESNPQEMIKLWSDLLLEIRKSLGSPKTKVDNRDMLRSFITDIDNYKFE
ncbi:MAG TPA: hypothetical protein PLM60_04620 [Methanoregulaceae archaeon]|nr:hypothetical protein [Methanoregulaceae archaeon]HPS22673.1 hypothetical protein [Methanoregulaceae archaeon]